MKKRRLEPAIELTSLVDILFLLIIFFVLTTTFARGGLEVTLPSARGVPLDASDLHTITLKQEGDLFWDGLPISEEQLILNAAREASRGRKIRLEGDRSVPYGHVIRLFDVLRKAGVEDLWLVVEERGEIP